jgi:hypothetical protein
MEGAATEQEYLQRGCDFQRYMVENMMTTSLATLPFLQAARSSVKGYEPSARF